jgi:hypothetical protein
MSINKAQLETDIKALMDETKVMTNQQESIDNFASVLADKIADAIKRGIDDAVVTHALVAGSTTVTGTITLTAEK